MSVLKILLTLCVIYIGVKLARWYKKRRRLVEAIEKLPGPPIVPYAPILNHAMVMIYLDSLKHKLGSFVIIYHLISTLYTLFPDTGICRFWLGWKPIVVLFSPENVEQVLNSTNVLNKADEYRFFEPWIGEGLVTSKKKKWRFRRKILTPAFHFRILNDFLPIMNGEATKLIEKLNQLKYIKPSAVSSSSAAADASTTAATTTTTTTMTLSQDANCHEQSAESNQNQSIDIAPIIALCTLDTICETAMGVNINCQGNEQTTDYVRSLYEVGETALTRVTRPWLWFDWIFYATNTGKRFVIAKDVMHDFSTKVILERKREWEKVLKMKSIANEMKRGDGTQGESSKLTFDDIMETDLFKVGNKRLAFLDLMLYQHLIENNMSIDDIREEVDTFMFAGHDTTAMSISWTLYMLGLHEDIQAKVRDEVDRVFELFNQDRFAEIQAGNLDGEEQDCLAKKLITTDITAEHLREMKYLDRVIKESLRLWPSIPFVARQMTEDLLVGDKYLIPHGATCMIFTHALHNNPKYYPKPEVFDPDRFSPENTLSRHPFAYIPFSAGPRNCIGQRFAQMELKVILAKIIRNYHIRTHDHRDKLKVVGELVLRSRNGLNVQIIPRFK